MSELRSDSFARPGLPPLARYAVMAVAMAVVTWFSLAPAHTFASVPAFMLHSDKVAHLLMYGLLVALGRWSLVPHWSFRLTFIPLVLGAITYGVVMEVFQGSLVGHGRACELGDILANSLGALGFWFLTGWLVPAVPVPAVPTITEN